MPQSGPPLEKYHPHHRHRKSNPSFSSSLLDAITRSLDDSDSVGAPHPAPPVTRLRHSTASISSSSSSSFFSSDTDVPVRIRPIRTGPVLPRSDRIRSDPPPNQTQKQNRNENQNLTSIKKKLRDLRRSAGPSSPGARLAGFLNSLFAGNPKKPKISSPASSSRSCLSKTPSTRGSGSKRSVRFSPVGVVVGEDCRPCGEKFVFAGMDAPARSPAVEEMMMMRGFAMDEDYESDSSDDLFELENLGGFVANNGNASFRDELPVYETTSLGINRAISRGLIV